MGTNSNDKMIHENNRLNGHTEDTMGEDPEITVIDRRGRLRIGDYRPGDRIVRDRYEVRELVGRGGMGVVYRCYDNVTHLDVALKTLPPEVACSTDEVEEIRSNFAIAGKLIHPNIAAMRTLEVDNGRMFLVMDYVDGISLKSWVRNYGAGKVLKSGDFLHIIRQVANALDYAHSQGVLHRDIKPQNIMVMSDNTAKLLDFGLAAQVRKSMSHVSMVVQDSSGTMSYMAPEQWKGRGQRAATDQYALAVTIYEVLAGNLPFECDDKDIMRQCVLNEEPEPLPQLSKKSNDALLKAMSKNPRERFESCSAFVNAFADGLDCAKPHVTLDETIVVPPQPKTTEEEGKDISSEPSEIVTDSTNTVSTEPNTSSVSVPETPHKYSEQDIYHTQVQLKFVKTQIEQAQMGSVINFQKSFVFFNKNYEAGLAALKKADLMTAGEAFDRAKQVSQELLDAVSHYQKAMKARDMAYKVKKRIEENNQLFTDEERQRILNDIQYGEVALEGLWFEKAEKSFSSAANCLISLKAKCEDAQKNKKWDTLAVNAKELRYYDIIPARKFLTKAVDARVTRTCLISIAVLLTYFIVFEIYYNGIMKHFLIHRDLMDAYLIWLPVTLIVALIIAIGSLIRTLFRLVPKTTMIVSLFLLSAYGLVTGTFCHYRAFHSGDFYYLNIYSFSANYIFFAIAVALFIALAYIILRCLRRAPK